MKSILVPVDGSEHACMAAAWAANLAANTGGKVTLLHVFNLGSAETMGLSQMSREDIQQKIESYAQKRFEKARAAMPADATFDTLAEYGRPADEIISVAKSSGFDHIVMGSRGLSPIGELLLGSVSERVLRRAPCPVTVVR